MRPDDGRVVSNFLVQALQGKPLTVYGDGTQTRSFCYVDDEVRGLLALLDGDLAGPVNIGNPDEFTILELAEIVLEVTGSSSEIVFEPLPVDDPTQRRPDITLARERLGWEPEVPLREGLERTADLAPPEPGSAAIAASEPAGESMGVTYDQVLAWRLRQQGLAPRTTASVTEIEVDGAEGVMMAGDVDTLVRTRPSTRGAAAGRLRPVRPGRGDRRRPDRSCGATEDGGPRRPAGSRPSWSTRAGWWACGSSRRPRWTCGCSPEADVPREGLEDEVGHLAVCTGQALSLAVGAA